MDKEVAGAASVWLSWLMRWKSVVESVLVARDPLCTLESVVMQTWKALLELSLRK